jgi:UDP-2,3-diacylglucosamine pyrophosphatase LpxH
MVQQKSKAKRRRTVLRFRTVVLSDIHLGTAESRVAEVNHLLKHVECKKLILNGDIIDGWSLLRKGGWNAQHTRFLRLVLKKTEKKGTQVVYTRGNHDDVLARFLPLQLHKLSVVEEHVHEGPRGRYLVVHGDVFDVVTRQHKLLAVAGHVGYQALLKLNRVYNRYRAWRGREYYSLSKKIKARVKNAVSHISNFETQLQELAKSRGCDGVICGHIHTPADKRVGDVHYLNSGDWVESLTALVEHADGTWEILTWDDYRLRLQEAIEARAAREGRRLPAVGPPDSGEGRISA